MHARLSMNSDIESLFRSASRQAEPETQAERVIKIAEQEFRGLSEAQESRKKEVMDIQDQLKKLKKKLRRTRNIRNSRKVEVNKKRSERRNKIKKDIELLRMRLQEIKLEG
ncbi:unnamed protein product [marine sediment metagenome]|uniref:BZIP domain-containing protein n=1 Tax=marine sediment metagenome TaxID=412755 RepID=X0XZU3_9ZZZZ